MKSRECIWKVSCDSCSDIDIGTLWWDCHGDSIEKKILGYLANLWQLLVFVPICGQFEWGYGMIWHDIIGINVHKWYEYLPYPHSKTVFFILDMVRMVDYRIEETTQSIPTPTGDQKSAILRGLATDMTNQIGGLLVVVYWWTLVGCRYQQASKILAWTPNLEDHAWPVWILLGPRNWHPAFGERDAIFNKGCSICTEFASTWHSTSHEFTTCRDSEHGQAAKQTIQSIVDFDRAFIGPASVAVAFPEYVLRGARRLVVPTEILCMLHPANTAYKTQDDHVDPNTG